MIKKLLVGVLCLAMTFTIGGCEMFGSNTSEKKAKDEFYAEGFFTETEYFNPSAGLMFTEKNGAKFLDPTNASENKTSMFSMDASMNVEALAFAADHGISFFNKTVSKSENIDDIVEKTIDESKSGSSIGYSISATSQGDKDIAGKTYKEIKISMKNSGNDIDDRMFLRIIDDKLFIVQVYVNSKLSTSLSTDSLMADFKQIDDSILSDKQKEADEYKSKLQQKSKEESNDKAKEETTLNYMKGIKLGDEYTNSSAGFKYTLPKDLKFSSIVPTAEVTAQTKDMSGIMAVMSETSGGITSINDYLEFLSNGLKGQNKELNEVSHDTRDELAGKEWAVLIMQGNIKGQTLVQKYYVRMIGKTVVSVLFQYLDGKEQVFEQLKSGFSAI